MALFSNWKPAGKGWNCCRQVGTVAILLLAAACQTNPELEPTNAHWRADNSLRPVAAPELIHEGDAQALRQAMLASRDYYLTLPAQTVFPFGPDRFTAEELAAFLGTLIAGLDDWGLGATFYDYLGTHARFYESAAASVLVTGYFEIRLQGSRQESDTYRHPLYGKPTDLVRLRPGDFLPGEYQPALPELLRGRLTPERTVVPYYSRHEIDRLRVLQGQGLELCWIDDPYRLFFLHIQGSGIVEFDDGSVLNVNYADSNGHPYRSIGRSIADRFGVDIAGLSMQGIYDFLHKNPSLAGEVMDSNPSYVFFRSVPQGPIGSLGRALSPRCSIATDARLFPKGALAFLDSELPAFDEQGTMTACTPYRGLVLNQDTGGAIRGPDRVDWFIGSDRDSERIAGHLKRPGRLFFLAPKRTGKNAD